MTRFLPWCGKTLISTTVTTLILATLHPIVSNTNIAAQTLPVVSTDRREYLVGETVRITGRGFAPNEAVTLRVRRPYSFFEADHPAHDPFVVTTDEDGRFEATWVLEEGLGVNFIVGPYFPSSAVAEFAEFHRRAVLKTDKRYYAPGDTANISGYGFSPGDLVRVSMEHASPLTPNPIQADDDGRISAVYLIDLDSSAATHRVVAQGNAGYSAWFVAMAGLLEEGTLLMDDGGPNDSTSSYYHWRETEVLFYRREFRRDVTPRVLDLTVAFDATFFDYVTPIINLDTNGNGRIDRAVYWEMEGDPLAYARYGWPWVCNDSSTSVCGQPQYFPGSAGVVLMKPTGGVTLANIGISLTGIGLPADGAEPVVINICSSSSDCVVTSGSGFLTIDQLIATGNDSGTFTIGLASGAARNGTSSWSLTPIMRDGGGVASVPLVSMEPGNYELREYIPAGWALTGARCQPGDMAVPAVPLPQVGPTTIGLENVVINPGQVTRCKFTVERVATTWE